MEGRILVVEDDDELRQSLVESLASEGFTVTAERDGRAALDALHGPGALPDVVLLDLMMPVMDGWEFRVEQLRDATISHLPVVAMSADPSAKAAAIDADEHLVKPFTHESLMDAVGRMLASVRRQRARAARLAQADRLAAVGLLAAGVAHEVNNPLAYAKLNLEVIEEQLRVDGEEAKARCHALLHDARAGIDRVIDIVKGLKTFARVDDERRDTIDVHAPLELAVRMTMHEVKHRARVVKQYGRTPPVDADDSRLAQVFTNLLINAAQAIPEGDAEGNEVRVVTYEDLLGRCVIEVRDTGTGIPADVRQHIFEPFFTTKKRGVGTGLGLSISLGIVEALGGQLSAEAAPRRGTVFRVVLPRSARAATPKPRDRREAKGPAVARGRVLVLDDDPIVCSSLTRALQDEHDVVALTSATDALMRIREGERFDVILCDVMMPHLTGPDLHREIGHCAPDLVPRIVFVSGGAFSAATRQFLEQAPNLLLEKPFDVAQVRAVVRDYVQPSPSSAAAEDGPPPPRTRDSGTVRRTSGAS